MLARRVEVLATCACAALILAAVPLRPFWLDEVLQLIGTRPENTLSEVIAYIPENPGSAPLGYLVQHPLLVLFGVSRWAARLPAALFGIAAAAATMQLARRLHVPRPWLAGVILTALPLMLRYGAEGRPYSQALFLSVTASLVFLRLASSPGPALLLSYLLVLVAAVYTHPFSVLVAGGHVLWAVSCRRPGLAAAAAGSAVLAGAAFVPWMVYARSGWQQTMTVSNFQFAAGWKTPLMLFREISGAGYVGSALLAILALTGARGLPREGAALLGGITGATLLCGLAADAVFGYFVAVRQFICVLPALAIMAAARPVPLLVAALAAACIAGNWRYFTGATEDWESAAAAMRAELHSSRCLMVDPPRDLRAYAALDPGLSRARCGVPGPEIVLALSPYRANGPLHLPEGYRIAAEKSAGGTRILVLRQ